MSLTSFYFLIFVLCTVLLYYAAPAKYRWTVLLAASVVFYVSYSIVGIFILSATALITYFSALRIEKIGDGYKSWLAENKQNASREERHARKKASQSHQRRYVAFVVTVSVGLLFLFKYYGYFASGINRAFSAHLWTAENLLLPLGISFYSLQLIGYVIDVSRGITKAEKNPLKVILYGSFFLSIMQGPFNRYNHLMPQLCREEKTKLSFYKFKLAVLKISWGYIKKMCIADQIGCIAREVFTNYTNYSGLGIALGMIAFAVQLYADFSGYMDIICGIGELMGIEMPQNFRQPFFSGNMSEFWRRWHITLGAWLKDYIFYPILKSKAFLKMNKGLSKTLGKKAGERIPTYLGMFILWTLIGAWHGAGFNYVFGVGILQFIYIVSGELTKPLTDRLNKLLHLKEGSLPLRIIQSVRCTLLMIFAWVFFNSSSFTAAVHMLGRLFAGKPGLSQIQAVFYSDSGILSGSGKIWLIYIVLCVLVLLIADFLHEKDVFIREKIEKKPYVARVLVYLTIVFSIIVFGAYGDQVDVSNFIYFNF